MEITSELQLVGEMNKILETIINNVSNKVLELLQNRIREDVYEFGGYPNKFYLMGTGLASGEFLRAWKWEGVKKQITSIVNKLWYDYLSMEYDPLNYKHGSFYGGDRREELAEDLNVYGVALNSDFPINGKERRPFWNNFLWGLFEENQLEKLFIEEFSNFGIIKF